MIIYNLKINTSQINYKLLIRFYNNNHRTLINLKIQMKIKLFRVNVRNIKLNHINHKVKVKKLIKS